MDWFRKKFDLKEIAKFLVGGGSAVLTDALVYMLLKPRMNVAAAKTISYISGAALGFLINKYWTFKSRHFRVKEIFVYIVLYAISAFANTSVNSRMLHLIPNTAFAFLCATGMSTVINFLGQKFAVFNHKKDGGGK